MVTNASGVRSSRWLDRGQAVAVAAVAAKVGLLARYWRGSPFSSLVPRCHGLAG